MNVFFEFRPIVYLRILIVNLGHFDICEITQQNETETVRASRFSKVILPTFVGGGRYHGTRKKTLLF